VLIASPRVPPGATGREDDQRRSAQRDHRTTAEAHVIPAPKPVMSAYSPDLIRPFSRASKKASELMNSTCCRSDPGDDGSLHGNAEALGRGLDDPHVGLVGDDEIDVIGTDVGDLHASSAESTTTRTARRKTSLPSIWKNPPCSHVRRSRPTRRAQHEGQDVRASASYSSTAAPRRHEQNRHVAVAPVDPRERFSEPMTRILCCRSRGVLATRTAYMKPLQAAFTSIAAQFSPSSLASIGADAGHSRSGVVVAITRKSMSPTSSPASSMAFRRR